MTIDDPALDERPFTETHDRILHALVEQVHDMSIRLKALEAQTVAASEPALRTEPKEPSRDTPAEVDLTDAPSTAGANAAPRRQSTRQTGWQPTRR